MELTMTGMDWIIGSFLLFGSMIFGLYLSMRVNAGEDSAHFFLGGRNMLWPVIGASYFATNIGAEHLVGLSGDCYRYGLCAGSVELNTIICLSIGAAFLFPHYIRNKVFTIPEFIEMRFNAAFRIFFSGFMIVVCIMTKMAFCLYAGALVLHTLLGWEVMATVAFLGVVTAIFTMVGGFAFVAYTDTIQAVIMIVGCAIMMLLGLAQVGGWNALVAKVPQAMSVFRPYDDPNYPTLGVIATAIYGGTFYWCIDQVNVQRALSAPNLQQARWGAMFAALLKLTPIFIFALPGIIALALFPGREPKLTFVTLLNDLLPSGVRGMVLAALVAALTSSLIAVLNSVSTMAVRDFVLKCRPATGEKMQVFLGRLAILAATTLGIGAAYLVYKTPDGLYKYLQTVSIYLTMPVAPVIIFGMLSKQVTMKGAVAAMGGGIILAALFTTDQLIGPEIGIKWFPWLHTKLTLNYAYRGLWGNITIVIILFIVSLYTRKTAPEKLEKTTVDWKKRIEPFQGLKDWRLQMVGITVATILLYIFLW